MKIYQLCSGYEEPYEERWGPVFSTREKAYGYVNSRLMFYFQQGGYKQISATGPAKFFPDRVYVGGVDFDWIIERELDNPEASMKGIRVNTFCEIVGTYGDPRSQDWRP